VTADGGADDIALRHDGAGTIQLLDHGVPVAITGGPATLTDTDTIDVTTGDGDDRVTIDESNGMFAPGLTAEGTGVSEIEFLVHVATGATVLRLVGQDSVGDTVDTSVGGFNVNGDDDVDVIPFYPGFATADDRWEIDGLGGNDTISGMRPLGDSCQASDIRLTIRGGLGDDQLTGGFRPDVISGAAGQDTVKGALCSDFDNGDELFGGPGPDTILGQFGNDVIQGGAGADDINGGTQDDQILGGAQGDTITGGDGADLLNGGFGDDTLHGTDGTGGNDTLNGKAGTDTCDADVGDTVRNCESDGVARPARITRTGATAGTSGRVVTVRSPAGAVPVVCLVRS
jgi:Ca2+-binding RTX toxin-like protein